MPSTPHPIHAILWDLYGVLIHPKAGTYEVDPDAKEVLQSLSPHYKMAVTTSFSHARAVEILKQLDLIEYFDDIVGGDQVQWNKPAPDIYLKAAENLGVEPKHCMVIDDTPVNLEGAKTATMRGIGRVNSSQKCEAFKEADAVVHNLTELKMRIDQTSNA